MGSDSLDCAASLSSSSTDLTTDPRVAEQQRASRKSAIWRLSRTQPHAHPRGVEESIAEEDEAVVHRKEQVSSQRPAHIADMAIQDDHRRSDSDTETDSSAIESDEPSEECEDDRCRGPQPPVWHCVDCDSSYCSECWALQGPHKPKKKGRDGVPHEKTNPHIVRRLKAILNPSKNADEIQKQHEDDESTKWFGVTRDLTGRPNFEDYGRYATLMSSISPIESLGNRYPQLVSFIGVTNAGKSTLIKMLVNHDNETKGPTGRTEFPSPIVGSIVNDTVPTSGDVHLYADPSTHAEQLPILYADCEGFEGGERTPLGARARRRANSDPQKKDPSKLGNVHTRAIEWAVSEEQRQREYAVTALYPRLLYTFSDCVVFVLRNPKTFQSAVLTKLLDWGVSALEKSINQPALPHCVVALNGTDPAVDEKEWDINYATQSLLSSVKGALDYVEGVPRFRELAEHWRSLGKHIYSVEDLILRYYSSFKVIRIPSKPRYMLINEQVDKLHGMIKSNCEESFKAKRRARMLTNADELNTYLQSGFDHFTAHLDVPFNFMQISLLRNPIPNDFGGHILQLCTTIGKQQPNHQPGRVAWMFEKLSVMLASCVLLDCARFRKGRVDELFTNYEKFFDYAMGEYLELHYPCSYVSPDGTRQCMLVKARHQPKGHQDEKGIIAAGDYEAAFDASFVTKWKSQLRSAIHRIQQDFQYELEQLANGEDTQSIPEERLALDLHIEYLSQFYETVGPAVTIISHATCFCCLMDVPEHALPCGHILCSACVKAYGKTTKSVTSMPCCPLHRTATKWPKPAIIKFKPTGAGVRVLCLDGGGIRGIVQLEVLRAIEQVLGGYIDIQAFFDLIVGTGTGGMLAVALATKDRTVDSCIDQFKAVCEHAFTPRMKGIPIVTTIAAAFGSGRRYKTKPLYSALKTAFGEDDPLFSPRSKLRTGSRVALTSTSATGRESILLASYRRPEDVVPTYHFERPHEPDMELKIWQTVAASIANPAHFRSFTFHGKTYQDGGLRMPNPAMVADRERRLIWPDVGEPDLFLSIGSGQHRMQVLNRLSELAPGTTSANPTNSQPAMDTRKRWRSKRVDDVLDAEIAWLEFREYAVRERSEARGRRFVRLNPDLEREPPASDNKNELEAIQLKSKSTAEKSEQVCTGSICCRFEDASIEMAALGKVFEDRIVDDFEPYFYVRPDLKTKDLAFKVTITMDVIRGMTDNGVFALPNIYIPLKDEAKPTSINLFLSAHDGLEPEGFTISNMPRVLLGEKATAAKNRPKRPSMETRTGSVASLRSPISHKASMSSATSDQDSISLNGPAEAMHRRSDSDGADSWHDVQARLSPYNLRTGSPKMSLADIISQSQGGGTSVRQRTNRFWTYIGNNHMVQHPELYTQDELARFAATTQMSPTAPAELSEQLPAELESPPMTHSTLMSQTSFQTAPSSEPAPQELEARDMYTKRRDEAQETLQAAKYASLAGTEFEEDGASTYSGQEAYAHASPVVASPTVQSLPDRSSSFGHAALSEVTDSSMPNPVAVFRLEEWLTAQKASGHLPRKSSRLRVVNEDTIPEES
ncbi:hypothetical protein AMS68_003558 [Peltaster fructicola]|uniref:PNPLA domain-containing protein n=1 Tax=Peltaster fructicola TaxID=286661 RepID=A0A6H0XTP1_9PEZI|nr:hypothetical protein AMS68_003558 [Peltaster fructicola]